MKSLINVFNLTIDYQSEEFVRRGSSLEVSAGEFTKDSNEVENEAMKAEQEARGTVLYHLHEVSDGK